VEKKRLKEEKEKESPRKTKGRIRSKRGEEAKRNRAQPAFSGMTESTIFEDEI